MVIFCLPVGFAEAEPENSLTYCSVPHGSIYGPIVFSDKIKDELL